MKNQQGFAHILGLIVLIAGLAVGLILVGQTQIFKPRASELPPGPSDLVSLYVVGGQVLEATDTHDPAANIKVEVYDDTLKDRRVAVTDEQGNYEVADLVRAGDAYSVRLMGTVNNDYFLTTFYTTTTEGWTWNFNTGLDTPQSSSYEFQRAGSNDCAGPNYPAGTTLRCNFAIRLTQRCSDLPCYTITTPTPTTVIVSGKYSTPTDLEVLPATKLANACTVTAKWKRVSGADNYKIYLNRVDDDLSAGWNPYNGIGNPPDEYTGDGVFKVGDQASLETGFMQRKQLHVDCNKNYHISVAAEGMSGLPSDKGPGMVFSYGHPTAFIELVGNNQAIDPTSSVGAMVVTARVGRPLSFAGHSQSIDNWLDKAEMWVTKDDDDKNAPDCGNNAKKTGRWCRIGTQTVTGQTHTDSISGFWTPKEPGVYKVAANWFDRGPKINNQSQCSGNPYLTYPSYGFSSCGPKSFIKVNVLSADE